MFAARVVKAKIEAVIRKGIIWHTQGSGQTELAFSLVHYLTAHFPRKGVVPKFYFIVDCIALMDQACREFRSQSAS